MASTTAAAAAFIVVPRVLLLIGMKRKCQFMFSLHLLFPIDLKVEIYFSVKKEKKKKSSDAVVMGV